MASGGTSPAAGGSPTVYVQSSDPGAVGAGKVWIHPPADPSAFAVLKVRNSADSGWDNPIELDATVTVVVGSATVLSAAANGFTAAASTGATLTVNASHLKYEADNGDDIIDFGANGQVQLDPQNGQVDVLGGALGGFLRLAATSEPADARLFNGSWILYRDGNDLKAKANIGGSFVHATLGTFS